MTDNRSHLEDIEIVGKSAEEIERDSQNRVNPPSLDDGGGAGVVGETAALPPVNSTGTWPGTTGLGAGTPEVPTGPVVPPRSDENR